jgi:ABC-type nitrate/sulfonate/bicarbonate transport system substrate-binding protein
VLRLSGDVWKNHACCVTFLAERDIAERPEWAQRVTNAIVKAQLWTRSNQLDAAKLLSSADDNRYTPHSPQVLAKVLATTDYASYEARRRRATRAGTSAASTSSPIRSRRTPSSWARCRRPAWKATPASCTSSTRPRPRPGGRPLRA